VNFDVGPILLAIGMVVLMLAIFAGGTAVAFILGRLLTTQAEADHPGSEFIALNR
jgi:hypothetical protein